MMVPHLGVMSLFAEMKMRRQRVLEQVHQKIARLPGLFKKLFCFGFRLGAKTTWGSELTALYEATEAPVGFIRISSNTALLAEDILYRITKELKQNRFLLEVYPWLTAKWEEENKDEIILPNGTMIQARGFMSIKMGPHPDREIIDDPHHPVEVKSDIIRQNFYQQWKSVSGSWKPALPGQAETAVLYIANFLHPLDPSVKFHENALVNEMGIDLSDWERIKFESGYHKKAPIWPEVWSMEKLEAKRRAMGWSIEEAAGAIGVDLASWRNWERGQTILYRRHRVLVASLPCLSAGTLDQDMASRWNRSHAPAL